MNVSGHRYSVFAGPNASGSPALVVDAGNLPASAEACNGWPAPELLRKIAGAANSTETTFLRRTSDGTEVRWFLPDREVELCVHGSLAAAKHLGGPLTALKTRKHGTLRLRVSSDECEILLQPLEEDGPVPTGYAETIARVPVELAWRAGGYLFAVCRSTDSVRVSEPSVAAVRDDEAFGLVLTGPGSASSEYVLRFFSTRKPCWEDPATGTLHRALAPWWARRLGHRQLTARQLSPEGGAFTVTVETRGILLRGKVIGGERVCVTADTPK